MHYRLKLLHLTIVISGIIQVESQSGPGQSCRSKEDCVQGAICVRGRCHCCYGPIVGNLGKCPTDHCHSPCKDGKDPRFELIDNKRCDEENLCPEAIGMRCNFRTGMCECRVDDLNFVNEQGSLHCACRPSPPCTTDANCQPGAKCRKRADDKKGNQCQCCYGPLFGIRGRCPTDHCRQPCNANGLFPGVNCTKVNLCPEFIGMTCDRGTGECRCKEGRGRFENIKVDDRTQSCQCPVLAGKGRGGCSINSQCTAGANCFHFGTCQAGQPCSICECCTKFRGGKSDGTCEVPDRSLKCAAVQIRTFGSLLVLGFLAFLLCSSG